MEAYEIADIELRRRAHAKVYEEFVRHSSMSIGLFVLPAGGVDTQKPHAEDEAYLVLRGRGAVTVADDSREVGPGSVVFVPARVAHRFHDISEELSIVVFFAPAEYSVHGG